MDSEEDMQDAYTSDGDYYGDEYSDDAMPTDEENDDSVFQFDNSIDELSASARAPQHNYIVLSEDEIKKRQEEAVKSVANVLSIPNADASILLRHFKWCISTVNDAWFANEQHVRKSVGLFEKGLPGRRPVAKEIVCGICFDPYGVDKMKAAACNHFFCNTCWTGYLHTAITDGPGCLTLCCPDPSCGAAVGEDLALSMVSEEDRSKYNRYLLRSFVEDNRKVKWCPAPGCDFALEYFPGGGSHDVVCKCRHPFCWNCLEDAHRPVDCETVHKWIVKNCAESENMNWIFANSKPCPKCKRPIEKNQGCMHMTCTPPCKFEFCWLCLGPWSEHGERTGGFYACNRYESAKQEGVYDEAERRREMAKSMLERYTHYYERWATNEASRTKALSDLEQMQATYMEKLSDRQCLPVSQLKFVTEAWLQIVECRRALKWTYAYGYYIPDNEEAKRMFFEYLQAEAESGLERLHMCAEKDLQVFLAEDPPDASFNEFRTKLAGLTSVTKTYFENLVRALENGLTDVDTRAVANNNNNNNSNNNNNNNSKSSSSSKASGSSKSKSGKKAGSSRSGGSSRNPIDESGIWSCERCTFANPSGNRICEVCNHPIPV